MPGSGHSEEWTVSTLHDYFLRMLDDRDKLYEQQFSSIKETINAESKAAKEAINKAEQASEKRFDNTNEWRASVNDRDVRLMPRLEADAKISAIDAKVTEIIRRVDKKEGEGSGLQVGWRILIASILASTAVITVIVLLMRK